MLDAITPELFIGGGVIPTPCIGGGTAPVIGGGVKPVADVWVLPLGFDSTTVDEDL